MNNSGNEIFGANSLVIGSRNKCFHDRCIIIGEDLISTDNNVLMIGDGVTSRTVYISADEHEVIMRSLEAAISISQSMRDKGEE